MTQAIAEDVEEILGFNGTLQTKIPNFLARSEQIELAKAITSAFSNKEILIAEAGTGIGKTFAYLVPSLIIKKKVLISTASKALQDQLFLKDLPLLINSLKIKSNVQILKGRANYICIYRTEKFFEQGFFSDRTSSNEITLIYDKLKLLKTGDKMELAEIAEDSSIWPYVTSTKDNCLGSGCALYSKCFVVKARKKAMAADIVVVNHHLFFADLKLKEEGIGELLPGVEAIIFDEAHQINEIATIFFGSRTSLSQIKQLINEIISSQTLYEENKLKLTESLKKFEHIEEKLLNLYSMGRISIALQSNIQKQEFFKTMECLQELLTSLSAIGSITIDDEESKRFMGRAQNFLNFFDNFLNYANSNILWLERFKNTLTFNESLYDIAEILNSYLLSHHKAWIFTSATLTQAGSIEHFAKPLGLKSYKSLILPSPFDYKNNAILYLPRGLADPKSLNYEQCLINAVKKIIIACQGRCFFLFTSYKSLYKTYDLLKNNIEYPLLVQGSESKRSLLSKFRAQNAVLMGTSTFWEGIDIKGEALSCVIIDKIPFASITDPILQAKMNRLKKEKLSPFFELSLPNAIIALKQGIGRLLRDYSDTGVLVLADPRLVGRDYSDIIFKSLPNMRKTRDECTVLEFIEKM